jgi:two-component system cell cycle response regulator DivK
MDTTLAPRRGALRTGFASPFRPVTAWSAGSASPVMAAGDEREPGTVLIADAHEDSRTVCAMLLRHNGLTVLEAVTGEEAIRLAHAHRPEAIVLTPVLRGVDGMRALDVLKQHPATDAIPVIVLSSVSGDEHEQRARAGGCAAYLLKPCPPLRVLETIRALTGRREAA